MTPAQIREQIVALRAKAEGGMPSTKAIGTAYVKGKADQALTNALTREFMRGQIEVLNVLLQAIDGQDG